MPSHTWTRDASEHYDFVPDGFGGVRLIPKGDLARADARIRAEHRARTRDAALPPPDDDVAGVGKPFDRTQGSESFLPRRRGMTDEAEQGEVLGTLEPPPEGLVYAVEEGDDGEWVVKLVPDDGGSIDTNDRTYHHAFRSHDAVLTRMNKANRAHWSGKTRDKENTLFRHYLAPGEKLEVRGPDDKGMYDLVLLSADQPDIAPSRNRTSVGDKGYVRGSVSARLAAINAANAAFYAKK